MDEYLVPTQDAETEFVEKRSRFIGRIWHTETEEEALEHIQQMRRQHYDATHNVYAYVIRDGAMRYSDDGEPQGTAGMPVLEVLRREEVYNVCCVVTRYFGGILLGAGGLVRAYAKSAKLALDCAGISRKQVWEHIDLPCPYAMYERMKQVIAACGAQILDTEYGAEIVLHCIVPHAQKENLIAKLIDSSAGRLTPICGEPEYRAFPVEKIGKEGAL